MAAMRAPESIETFRQRKADRRTEADDLRMELMARAIEARMLLIHADPYLSRLEVVAQEVGPAAQQTVMGLRGLITRYDRQWTDPEGNAA